MAEFCVAVPVLVLLLWSILYLTEMFVVKHETMVAARYGTWLLSRYDNVPENKKDFQQISDLIAKNFFGNRPQQNLSIEPQHIPPGLSDFEFDRDDASVLIQRITSLLSDNLLGTKTPTIYSLKVQYNYPTVFGAVDLRKKSNNFFGIKSDHYVLGNSWDGQRVKVHDLIDIIEELIGDIVEEVVNL